jgi:TRAP-type transport system periplasmic protein
LDYSFLNAGNVLSNRLYEPAKFNCGPVMTISGHVIIIGKRTLDRLPKDIQDILVEEAGKSQAEYLAFVEGHEKKAIDEIKAAGGTFKSFPDAELEKWKKATPDLLAAWASDLETKGDGPAARAVEKRWRELTAAK